MHPLYYVLPVHTFSTHLQYTPPVCTSYTYVPPVHTFSTHLQYAPPIHTSSTHLQCRPPIHTSNTYLQYTPSVAAHKTSAVLCLLQAARKKLRNVKVPHLKVFVKAAQLTGRNASVHLKDPTGSSLSVLCTGRVGVGRGGV